AKNMSGTNYDDDFNPKSLDDVLNRCENHNKIIIKATIDTGSGKNIQLIKADTPLEMRKRTKESLVSFKKDYVIQQVIEQHNTLKRLNPSSVNTIRITTFLHNNQVSVLSSHLRIGNEDSIYDHYGIVCGIQNN